MKCLLIAIKFINDKESYHGDICPEFVYLDSRTGRYAFYELGNLKITQI